MIARIRTRDEFQRLRRHGRRVRSGPLWCTYVLESTLSERRVAFAIGRPVGNAVRRNRLRRRLRAVLADAPLPPGWFLVGARPGAGELTFDQVRTSVERMIEQLASESAGS